MEFAIGAFEGPLDLLLALVRKEEMDIKDIDIHKITSQYLDVIRSAEKLNLNEGGEFIRMAAILMLIKSKSLLPCSVEENEEEEPEISKSELIQALAQHSQFLKVAEQLDQRLILNRDIWSCPGLSFAPKKEEEPAELSSLMMAFRKILKQTCVYEIKMIMPTVSQWIYNIRKYFIKGKILFFSQLIQKNKQEPLLNQMLLSFLSLLELGKLGIVSLSQQGRDIQIYTKKDIDESILKHKMFPLSRVEYNEKMV